MFEPQHSPLGGEGALSSASGAVTAEPPPVTTGGVGGEAEREINTPAGGSRLLAGQYDGGGGGGVSEGRGMVSESPAAMLAGFWPLPAAGSPGGGIDGGRPTTADSRSASPSRTSRCVCVRETWVGPKLGSPDIVHTSHTLCAPLQPGESSTLTV